VGRERLRTPATAAEQALGSHPADAVRPTDLYDDQDAAEGTARGAATGAEGS
jgi:hypothetical protein